MKQNGALYWQRTGLTTNYYLPSKSRVACFIHSVVLYTLIRAGKKKSSVRLYWYNAFDQVDKFSKETVNPSY